MGILVDDATVAIENINSHLEQGKDVEPAILDGAAQIAVPALVSTLCICIVFIPMFFLGGVSRYLFVPMAEAVVFAMLASYILSRTLVPTLAKYWLKPHAHKEEKRESSQNPLIHLQHAFEQRFEAMRQRYSEILSGLLARSGAFITVFLVFLGVSIAALGPWIGSDFFPAVDGGQIKLHMRAPFRHARRGNGGALRQGGCDHPPRHPRARTGHRHRQYRPCRTAASICRIATQHPSAPPTRISSCR